METHEKMKQPPSANTIRCPLPSAPRHAGQLIRKMHWPTVQLGTSKHQFPISSLVICPPCCSLPLPLPPAATIPADDVHGCYQDVIGQMLSEQERARVSRSELLNAQTSHQMWAGDQGPAFQELQVRNGLRTSKDLFIFVARRHVLPIV